MSKLVVITGAGSGIGRATALAFAQQGARVALCDIDRSRVDAVANELGKDRVAVASVVDVSERAQVKAFADEVHAQVSAVDVIVNNAGVALGGVFLETSLDDFDWLLGVNLRGVVHGCHYFVPRMAERGQGGHVVNISSVLGICPAPNGTAYSASKFAVLGFSQSLRSELAPHKIGVTAICPGMIATSIIDGGRMSKGAEPRRGKIRETFARRGASPSIVADAIVDSVKTNPAVRPVGRDGWAGYMLMRLAPGAVRRLGSVLQKQLGGAG